jgi:hypothetical protein
MALLSWMVHLIEGACGQCCFDDDPVPFEIIIPAPACSLPRTANRCRGYNDDDDATQDMTDHSSSDDSSSTEMSESIKLRRVVGVGKSYDSSDLLGRQSSQELHGRRLDSFEYSSDDDVDLLLSTRFRLIYPSFDMEELRLDPPDVKGGRCRLD